MMNQFRLEAVVCDDPYTIRKMTCWIKDHGHLKPGAMLTLKGRDERWRVVSISDPHELYEVKRGWNVGGLNTPQVKP